MNKSAALPTGFIFLFSFISIAHGIGWDENDFIFSNYTGQIAVFDHDWSFKGYIGECSPEEHCRTTGLDFDAEGNLVSAWQLDSGETIRTYQQSDGSLVSQFSPTRISGIFDVGIVVELKVGPTGNIITTNTDGPIKEYTKAGELVQYFNDPALYARQIGSRSRITDSSGALAVLPNGEIWASESTQSPLSYVYAFDPIDLNSAGPVFVGNAAPEELTEPVAAELVSLPRASSLQYLPESDTILALGYFKDTDEEDRTFRVWEISASTSQIITIESPLLVGPDTIEVQYRQLVNRYDSELTSLNNTTGVTRGPNGDVFAVALGSGVHHWAYSGSYLGEQTLSVEGGDTFDSSFNILWTGNSPQFAIPEPKTLTLLLFMLILLTLATYRK